MLTTLFFCRQYESSVFAQELLDILRVFGVPSWSQTAASYPVPSIQKVSGSLTNAVFFVSSPSTSSCTLLLRLFGPSSGSLVARSYELHVLHLLSSRYKLGPRIYGTFTNGRVEEYFDSVALTASNMREPRISGYIGARMAELHSIDLATIKELSRDSNIEIGVWKNVRSWLPRARDALPAITPTIREELSLDVFQKKWEGYIQWLKDTQDTRAVFCHNDVHYGNILRLNSVNEGTPEHHRVCPSPTFPLSPRLRVSDRFFLRLVTVNRSFLSTLSTRPQTQPPSTSRTTSTSGQPTTTAQHRTCLTRRATRTTPNDARSSPLTSRTAQHHRTCPPLETCPPPRASVSLLHWRRLSAHGALRRMPCGRCGAWSSPARTLRRASPSPSLIMLATLAAAWPHSIASLLSWVFNFRFVYFIFLDLDTTR